MSEIKVKDLERTIRFDAEFYKKENLFIEKTIRNTNPINLSELVKFSDGNHMSISDKFIEKGIPYYRGQDIHDFFIENANPICIDKETFDSPYIKRSHLKKSDILLSIVGTIGKLSLVTTNDEQTCSCKLAILRTKGCFPQFLAIYLSSIFGQNQIRKYVRGAVQMGLILEDLDQIYIPNFSNEFQLKIELIVNLAHQHINKSKSLYTEAEEILLQELGLSNWQPTIKNNNKKTLKESFLQSGRIDAEYYQPKYDELLARLTQFDCKPILEIVNIKKSIEPGSDAYQTEGLPFIRVADLSKMGITESTVFLDPNNYNAEELKPRKDTILLSKDGSVGIAFKVDEDIEGITSSAILHLRIYDKEILPDYLCLVLNSLIVQLQAERDAGGSIIQHWKPDEIKQVIIPVLGDKQQKTISKKIQESFTLQKLSKKLLEIAKKAVEMAIEEGEEYAIDYINLQ